MQRALAVAPLCLLTCRRAMELRCDAKAEAKDAEEAAADARRAAAKVQRLHGDGPSVVLEVPTHLLSTLMP